jgi:hypothetical protein
LTVLTVGASTSRLATGDWRLAARDWRLATGDWRLATGDWQLDPGSLFAAGSSATRRGEARQRPSMA